MVKITVPATPPAFSPVRALTIALAMVVTLETVSPALLSTTVQVVITVPPMPLVPTPVLALTTAPARVVSPETVSPALPLPPLLPPPQTARRQPQLRRLQPLESTTARMVTITVPMGPRLALTPVLVPSPALAILVTLEME